MSRRYWYGEPDEEMYMLDDPEEVAADMFDDFREGEVIELTTNRKAEAFCQEHSYFDPECGVLHCDEYSPRNGKNGICKHHGFGLKPTGRKWKVDREGKLIKISSRKRK